MIDYKHPLSSHLREVASHFEEFANGAAQATVKLKNGLTFDKVLISNATAIIAMRGYDDIPFSVSDIDELFQTDEDKAPGERGHWKYWDEWR